MAASHIGKLKLFLVLLPIPLAWIAFSQLPIFEAYFKPLANLGADWRFQMRGPLDVPEVKIVYADFDSPTISMLGERPWSRRIVAQLTEILFEVGGAKAIGYDFIYSRFGTSEMVPVEWVRGADLQLGAVISSYPNIVLAANYTQTLLPLTLEERQIDPVKHFIPRLRSEIPLIYFNETLPPEVRFLPENTFPEMPTFPVIGLDILTEVAREDLRRSYPSLDLEGDHFGTIGLIVVDTHKSAGPVPRWVPLYTQAVGPYWTLNLLEGLEYFYDTVDPETPELIGDEVIVFDSEGSFLAALPYITEKTFYHFSVQLALKYLGLTEDHVTITEKELIISDDDGVSVIRAPMEEGQITEVNWFSPWLDSDRNPRSSVSTVFQQFTNLRSGEGEIQQAALEFFEMFEDAIVLVGPVDHTLQDLAPTPFDSQPVPKVGMHGNMIKTLFSGQYIKRPDRIERVIILLGLTFVVALLGLYSGRGSFLAKAGSVLVLVGYVACCFIFFNLFHLLLPLVVPVASAITTTAAGTLIQLLVEERQKGRIKGMFGTYLSPELVNTMVESGEEPQLGGIDAEITALFSDVQSFSAFSELLTPAQLVALMNEYLTAMTDILKDEGAYVDKYIGDAIVAMFNAPVNLPDHALRACVAAARMQQRQIELRQKWASEGDKWPTIVSQMQTRIGMNTGYATVGNMGSENRFNYTMMGDTVNLAARCESGAKSAGVYTLVSAATRDAALTHSDSVIFRFIDKWQVKGRSQPVDMHEVVGLRPELPDSALECVMLYEQALEAYFQRDWDRARDLFERSADLEPNQPGKTPGVTTSPSLIMMARCLSMKENPPEADWDGVYVMKTK